MAEYLLKKKGSSVWYYRRRYPEDVAKVLKASMFMKSLKTPVKRDAEKLSRQLSVEFDTICHEVRVKRDAVHAFDEIAERDAAQELRAEAESLLASVPQLIRLAAVRVIEEQRRDPRGWLDTVKRWESFYEAMKMGKVPNAAQRPALEAQAFLNGIRLVVQGKPLPPVAGQRADELIDSTPTTVVALESWSALTVRALKAFSDKVGSSRYQLAQAKLPQVSVQSTAEHHVHEGLKAWCVTRLAEVKPRTVKSQLDCMVSALRCVMPKLQTPDMRELRGVMQPRVDDRQAMPVRAIRRALDALQARPASSKVRIDYGGGASQFDDIALEVLAVLGMRPRELIQAKSNAIFSKTDVFENTGWYLRIVDAKNEASEREIPLSDGLREAVSVSRLREMLAWQECNPRAPHGAVSSLGTRFRRITGTYTLYQMRHAWKDVAVHRNVDFELRERLLGHRVPGVASAYGSGIPLRQGLDALMSVRSEIFGQRQQTDWSLTCDDSPRVPAVKL